MNETENKKNFFILTPSSVPWNQVNFLINVFMKANC